MSRMSGVPVAIVQMVESMLDKSTPSHVRFNQKQTLENVRDYCDAALKQYEKKNK